jgi:hypothetical protein
MFLPPSNARKEKRKEKKEVIKGHEVACTRSMCPAVFHDQHKWERGERLHAFIIRQFGVMGPQLRTFLASR